MKRRIAYALSLTLGFSSVLGGASLPSLAVYAAEDAAEEAVVSEEAPAEAVEETVTEETVEEATEEAAEESAETVEETDASEEVIESETTDAADAAVETEEEAAAESTTVEEATVEADTLNADASTETTEADLVSAFKAGGTLQLKSDVKVSSNDLTLAKDLTIDLNSYTITLDKHYINVKSKLTLKIGDTSKKIGSIIGTNQSSKSGSTTTTYGLIEISGGTVEVDNGVTIALDSSALTAEAKTIAINKGTLDLTNGSVEAKKTTKSKSSYSQTAIEVTGGIVNIAGKSTVSVAGGKAIEQTAGETYLYAGKIDVAADTNLESHGMYLKGGTFNIVGGNIEGTADEKKKAIAGVFISGGTLNLADGSINGCTYGVYTSSTTATKTLNLGGGYIEKNTHHGLHLHQGTTVELSGSAIRNNITTSSGLGAGIYMESGTTLNISEEGSISNNGYVTSNGTTTVNTAKGGGIYATGATITMSGGSVSNNQANSNGAGIYLESTTFTMTDGQVTSNKISSTSGSGGGIYYGSGTFTIYGTPKITSNTIAKTATSDSSSTTAANNLYISSGSSGVITVDKTTALESGARIGVSVSKSGDFTSGYSEKNSEAPSTYFTSDDTSKYTLSQNSSTKEATMTAVKTSSSSSSSSSKSSSKSSSSSSSSSGGGGGSSSSSFSKGDIRTGGSGTSKADYSKKSSTTVMYEEPYTSKKKTTTVTVPSTVKIKSKTYKVVSISEEAFADYKKLTSVAIGTNLQKIGARAFKNCKKLSSLKIYSTNLKKNKVKKCLKGSYIKTIYVPSSKVKAYKKIFTKENTKSRYQVQVLPISR